MLKHKKIKLVLLSLASLAFTACGNNGMQLSASKPNSTSSASRIITTSTTGTGSGSFSSSVALTYYPGATSGSVLQGVSVARNTSNQNQIKITAPSVGTAPRSA